MSAQIYALPEGFKDVPSIWDMDNDVYEKAIQEWSDKLKQWCKERNPSQDQKYIGEIVKWCVADGYAEYMVASLSPLELIHLPVMDAYQYGDADLQTVKRIKDKIDSDKSFNDYLNTIPKVGEVNDVLDDWIF